MSGPAVLLDCLPVRIPVIEGYPEDLDIALGVSFAASVVLGVLLGTVFAWFFFKRYYKNRTDKVAPSPEHSYKSNTHAEGRRSSDENLDVKSRRGTSPTRKRRSGTDSAEVLQPLFVYEQKSPNLSTSHGLFDVLTRPDRASSLVELSYQDLLAARRLEEDVTEERVNVALLLLKQLTLEQSRSGHISASQYHSVLVGVYEKLADGISESERKRDMGRENLQREIKGSMMLAVEQQKLETDHISNVNNTIQDARLTFRQRLMIETKAYSDGEVDLVLNSFSDNMAKLENKIQVDQLRQLSLQYRNSAQRTNYVELYQLSRSDQSAEMTSRQVALTAMLQSLTLEHKIPDKQRLQIIEKFSGSLRTLQTDTETEFSRQVDSWQTKLRETRREKFDLLEEQSEKRRRTYLSRSDKVSSITSVIETYHELMSQLRSDREKSSEQMDQYESQVIDSILKERDKNWQKGASEIDEVMRESLLSLKIPSRDVDKWLRIYRQELHQQQKSRSLKNAELIEHHNEELKEAHKKSKRVQQESMHELHSKKLRADGMLDNLLQTQVDLSEDSRRKLIREHEEDLLPVANRLQLLQNCWNKLTERELSLVGHKSHQIRNEIETLSSGGGTDRKTKQKLQQLEKELQEEDRKVKDTKLKIREAMEGSVSRAETAMTGVVDERLARLVGHAIASRARAICTRRARQLTGDKNIEDKILQRMLTELSGSVTDSELQKVLQRHRTRTAELLRQMKESRVRQQAVCQKKVEARSRAKEREVLSKLEAESGQIKYDQRKSQLKAVKGDFDLISLDERRVKVLSDLSAEFSTEQETLKEEMDNTLHDELVRSLKSEKKIVIAHLALLAKISKDDIHEIVDKAVLGAGGEESETETLTREIRYEVQGIKDDPEGNRQSRRNTFDEGLSHLDRSLPRRASAGPTDRSSLMRYRGGDEYSPSHLDGSLSRRGTSSLERRLSRTSPDGSDDEAGRENSLTRRTNANLAGRSLRISASGDLGDGLGRLDNSLARNVSPTLARRASQSQRYPYNRDDEVIGRLDSSLSRRTSPIPAGRSSQRFPSDGYEGIVRPDTSLTRRAGPSLAGKPSQRLSYTLDDDGTTRLDNSPTRRMNPNLASQRFQDSEEEDFRARPGSSLSRRSSSVAGRVPRGNSSGDDTRMSRLDSSLGRRPNSSLAGRSFHVTSPSESEDGERERDDVKRGWKNYETNVRDSMYLKQRGSDLQRSPVRSLVPLSNTERASVSPRPGTTRGHYNVSYDPYEI